MIYIRIQPPFVNGFALCFQVQASSTETFMKRRRTTGSTTGTTSTATRRIYDDFDQSADDHGNNDRVYISDRIHRLIQTSLDIDDDDDMDDEIHITSTGQTIKLQDLFSTNHFNNVKRAERQQHQQDGRVNSATTTTKPSTGRYQDYFKRKMWANRCGMICSKRNHRRHENSWTNHFCDFVPKYTNHPIVVCSITSFLIILLFIWYYYNYARPRSNKTLRGGQPSSKVTKLTTTNTTTVEHPVAVSSTLVDNNNDKSNQIPPLIEEGPEDKVNRHDVTPETLCSVLNMTTTNFDKQQESDHLLSTLQMSLIPEDRELATTTTATPDDHADHVVTFVSALQQKCQSRRIEYDPQTLWQWAMQQQTTQQYIKAQEMMQVRHCIYDHTQQTMNRQQQQQHHDEVLTSRREDPHWFTKLNTIRSKCHDTILRTIYQCCIGLSGIVILQPFFLFFMQYSKSSSTTSYNSITDWLCYNTGTIFDPSKTYPNQPTSVNHHYVKDNYVAQWFDRYTSAVTYYYYLDSTPTILSHAATCATILLGRLVLGVGAILAWCTASWLLHQLTFGAPRIQFLCKSSFLVYILVTYNWIPTLHLYRMMITLGIILSICYGSITHQYYTIRNKFLSVKQTLPQISVVNEALSWFDDMVHHIQLIPIVAVTGLLLMLLTST